MTLRVFQLCIFTHSPVLSTQARSAHKPLVPTARDTRAETNSGRVGVTCTIQTPHPGEMAGSGYESQLSADVVKLNVIEHCYQAEYRSG
ncbi:hypothetical protein BaRGS_00014117 [Batillaria attramentaria]|uniref:Secreted protein n=1 Tax=Batillaria attramentaria TaxID=370345 RepID=A0ABD0L5M7_9CAEN